MLQTRDIEIQTADGSMPLFIAEPEEDGPHPAVLVIMEAYGRVPHICDVARRIASEGYVAAAPDFYYREIPNNRVPYDETPRAVEMLQRFDDEKFLDDMKMTLAHLKQNTAMGNSKVGVTGFCMGGRLSFLSACALPNEFSAVAPFYGAFTVGHLPQASAIQCPLQMFFGDQDPFIPEEEIQAIEQKLSELGKEFAIKTYEGADHGFFCDERESFHEAAAADAWSELKAFFARCLR